MHAVNACGETALHVAAVCQNKAVVREDLGAAAITFSASSLRMRGWIRVMESDSLFWCEGVCSVCSVVSGAAGL